MMAALGKLGIGQPPQSLSEVLHVMERSELVHEALGEHIFEWYVRNKRREDGLQNPRQPI